LAARRPVERAEELQERRLPRAARPFERDELAGFDRDADAADGAHVKRAFAELALHIAGLVEMAGRALRSDAHSTALSASAGRSRAALKAPAAPASRPPTSASRKPATRISTERGASSLTLSLAVRASAPKPN